MMFVNKKDSLRKAYGIKQKPAESLFGSNMRFALPMPAMGELICKVRDKQPDDYRDSLNELCRLMDKKFLEVRYIVAPSDVYQLANQIAGKACDPRDRISPMDALIIAIAAMDQDCDTFYTTDSRLITDGGMKELIDDCRIHSDLNQSRIADISDILKIR